MSYSRHNALLYVLDFTSLVRRELDHVVYLLITIQTSQLHKYVLKNKQL